MTFTRSFKATRIAAVKGDVGKKAELADALRCARKHSLRGAFTLPKAHNPVQHITLRQVSGKDHPWVGVARKALADPARGWRS